MRFYTVEPSVSFSASLRDALTLQTSGCDILFDVAFLFPSTGITNSRLTLFGFLV